MSSKSDTGSLNVVDLASSDEDENPRLKTKTSLPSSQTLPTPTFNESRSFWKAGAYDVVASTSQTSSQGFLEHARIHPKFLHTNATSHKWAFGAIAELLDNAVDEICNGATYVKVDKIYNRKDNSPALLFQDNGGGMDPEGMRKCMSLGYSSKKTNTTIGQYGNGFKTSTMRLGADAIVFSRNICGNHATQSIGLLSYTFLRRTGLDDIIVPMIDFDLFDHGSQPITYGSQNDWTNNLKTILDWSPFSSRDDLMLQFEDIGPHGTKVIVYNLWLDDDGLLELDFDYNDEDIRLNEEGNTGNFLRVRRELLESHISYCYRFSLRAYVSILYLQRFSGFQIILRGKPVQQFSIVDGLKFPKVISYKPQLAIASKEATVETTIGFVKEAPALQVHGVNIYHKNRLIMPFFTVVPSGSSRGQGVVGVLEANFIEPAHDKQDFERTALFIRLEVKLKQIIVDYWVKNSHFIGLPRPRCEKPKTSQAPTSRPPVGLSNMQKNLPHSQSFFGVPANTWAPSEGNERHDTTPASYYPVRDAAEPPCSRDPVRQSVQASDNEVTDISESAFVDTICDENIQLFMRSENYRQKEAELKQMVEDLQGELEEKRRKCLQLALSIQLQRKQKSLNP